MTGLFALFLMHVWMFFPWDALLVWPWKCLCMHPLLYAEPENLILLQVNIRKPQMRFLQCSQLGNYVSQFFPRVTETQS